MAKGRGEVGSGRKQDRNESAVFQRLSCLAVAACCLLLAVGVASAPADAPGSFPTAESFQEAIDAGSQIAPLTDPQAAEQLPHRDLDRGEAINLMQAVFAPELQGPAGVFDDLHVEKFLSDNVAVIAAGDQPASAGVTVGEDPSPDQYEGPILMDSTVPLRTEATSGHEEVVDLSLEHSEGELQPANPLVDIGIPQELGKGVEIADSGVEIELAGAPQERSPSTVEQSVAVYPEVAQDTSLAVAPTPTGLETMTLLQSADAPLSQTFHLQLPDGADLRATSQGGAEVVDGERTVLSALPPTALDANGDEVPVSLEISGDSLSLHVSPLESSAYPILVDPLYQTYSWYPNKSTGLSDWNPTTNTSAYAATAYATCSSCPYPLSTNMPGLYLRGKSGSVGVGSQAFWTYYVPRFWQDVAQYGVAPTSFLSSMGLQNLGYWVHGDKTNSPYLTAGIWNSSPEGWAAYYGHGGGEGELTNFGVDYSFANSNQNARLGVISLYSNTTHSLTADREIYVGAATMGVGDTGAPNFGSISSPSGWVDQQSTYPLGYTINDTGLGVYSLTATPINWQDGWEFKAGCVGIASNPCPHTLKSTDAGSPVVDYHPSSLPTGIDTLKVTAKDPVGNVSSTANVEVKVDHTAPSVTLSGPLTQGEAKTAGPGQYNLHVDATDGTQANPQSGIKTISITVDGATVPTTLEQTCPSGSCGASRDWVFNVANYSDGDHLVKVIATDQVGRTTTLPDLHVLVEAGAPVTSKIVSPTDGTQTARRLKLKSAWSVEGVTGVTYQWKTASSTTWQTIPTSLAQDAKGQPVSWPMAAQGKTTAPVYFDVAHVSEALEKQNGPLQVRAFFDGPAGVAGHSVPVGAVLNEAVGSSHDAQTQIGPGALDLLTGNFKISQSDVSIPGFGSAFEFARTNSSRVAGGGNQGVLGSGWQPSTPVEVEGGGYWRSARDVAFEEGIEYTVVTDIEGNEYPFEHAEGGGYVTPPELSQLYLTSPDSTHLVLGDPSGTKTTFEKNASGTEYLPISVTQSAGNSTQMIYQVVEGKRRLKMVIAPTPPGLSSDCVEGNAATTLGCHSVTFSYQPATTWGAPSSYGERLATITYYGASGSKMEHWEVAKYEYNAKGMLTEEWDPRIAPALKTKYTYKEETGPIQTLTPPGEEPWTFQYSVGDPATGHLSKRLLSASRPSLLASPSTAKTTIAYEVPLSGSGAPYDMSGANVAKWGQLDLPTDATAVFPPDEVPASPPTSYSRAAVYYMDGEAQLVNTATPSGAGTSAPSITTAEPDEHGNIVRELTAQNRLRALAAENSVKKAEELETKRLFSADGTEMLEEWGPLHSVRLESGSLVQARLHKIVKYDEGAPSGGSNDIPKPHLPTRETTGASIPGQGTDADQKLTETRYDWTLRKPTEVIVDPLGLNLRSRIFYDSSTGQPTETRLPANPQGGDAHATKTIYYSASTEASEPACQKKPALASLPCEIMPAAQPGTPEQPQLLVRRIASYSPLGQPKEVIESPGGEAANTRTTTITYDAAGRPTSNKQQGGGAAIPKTETLYNASNGRPTTQQFVCESSCEGFDNQAVTATYDTLGRPTSYQDADGNTAETTYDLLGRPVTTTDGKGTQTSVYDPTSGLPIELQDSAAGTFTASYDADGNMVERGLPDGLVAKTTYDETGAPVHLSYNKMTNCVLNCTWLDFGAERSIYGQVLAQTSTLSSQQYSYDNAGRLKLVKDTPQGGSCTTRSYSYDADSNRTALVTRAPGLGGACDTTSEGSTQSYSYDAADRLLGTGLTYDNFGRITSLPGPYAGGGSTLTTSYFSNDMVASQSQGGITNTFQLDAARRQRQRAQTGGSGGTEVFHYAGSSDSPAWTARGSAWTRSIVGIGGELAAIQDSASGTTLQLTNLHGDIAANASLSPTATEPTASFEFDEFGNPKSGSAGRYGWLGGKRRRTELPSGVIQMGVRSYVPAMGRFISLDPVPGGSANAYDYANQDPVNNLDLTGEKFCIRQGRVCGYNAAGLQRAIRHANSNEHHILPIVIHCHCVNTRNVLEQATHVVSHWTTPVQHWTAARARELGSAVSGAASSIPCRQIGLALGAAGVTTSSAGLATVWIPGVGETLLLVGSGIDLAGVAADLSHEKGAC